MFQEERFRLSLLMGGRWAGGAFFGVPALIPMASGSFPGILRQCGGASFEAKPLLASPTDTGTLLKCSKAAFVLPEKKGVPGRPSLGAKLSATVTEGLTTFALTSSVQLGAIKHQARISANKLSAQVAQFSSLNKGSHHLPAMSNDAE